MTRKDRMNRRVVLNEDNDFTVSREVVIERNQAPETLESIRKEHRQRMKGSVVYRQGYVKGVQAKPSATVIEKSLGYINRENKIDAKLWSAGYVAGQMRLPK